MSDSYLDWLKRYHIPLETRAQGEEEREFREKKSNRVSLEVFAGNNNSVSWWCNSDHLSWELK